MKLPTRSLAMLLLCVPALARAQLAPPPPETTVVEAPPSPGLDQDPHVDRAWFSPTAVTQPAGTVSFNDWELALLGVTYAATDNFQLSGFVVPPLVEDMPFIGAVSAKLGFSADGRLHFAALGGLAFASVDDDSGVAAGLGGAVSLCIDAPCASLVSAFVYAAFFEGADDAVPLAYGLSLIARVATHVKIVLEAGSAGVLARGDDSFADALLLSYGVRFFSGNLAGDVGFVRPVVFDDDYEDPFVLGVPAVTFSYRWGGR